MSLFQRILTSAAALALLIGPASIALQARAQVEVVPVYTTWQPEWDTGQYDRRHVIFGTVTDFSPYRLTIQRRDGVVQTVDLRNGTVIYPTGATPTVGQTVALVGRYSNGTFVAGRVVLRNGAMTGAVVAPGAPVTVAIGPNGVPMYTTWQTDWDAYRYDQGHVILGTVTDFAPYRLTVQRRNGGVQTVDLKNGTVIYPEGSTPSPGQRVALVGYYSNGTFIANRVVLRP